MFEYKTSSSSPSRVSLLTLRDPAGCLFDVDGKLIRGVYPHFVTSVERALTTQALRKAIADGKFIPSFPVSHAQSQALKDHLLHDDIALVQPPVHFYEHPRLSFVSYPYEWAPEMLYAAGLLTLDLADSLLDEGFELKDATPYNILFDGPNPTFVDLLSVTERNLRLPLWLAFGQFTRLFLHPLLAERTFRLPITTALLQHHDGLSTESMYRFASWSERLKPAFLTSVSIPYWLSSLDKNPTQRKLPSSDPEKAKYIIKIFLKNLRRQLNTLAPRKVSSHWTAYESGVPSYSDESKKFKVQTMSEWINNIRPARVLDLGCNTGEFSVMCAEQKAHVVSVDSDPATVGILWNRAREKRLPILPLVVNLADPTPGTGWKNQEGKSFIDRATNSFDCVLALALVHHLYLTHGIPASEIAQLLHQMTRKNCIIEFVGPEDAMVKQLTRRIDTVPLTQSEFERAIARYFRTVRKQTITGSDRCLYLLEKQS